MTWLSQLKCVTTLSLYYSLKIFFSLMVGFKKEFDNDVNASLVKKHFVFINLFLYLMLFCLYIVQPCLNNDIYFMFFIT